MMNTNKNNEQLIFFGKITASISHELNNVFSILNEYSGFFEDTLNSNEFKNEAVYNKLASTQSRLTKQISRGTSIIRKMNKFAHTVDHAECETDLNILLANFLAIYKRLAEHNRTDIEFQPTIENIKVKCNPFIIQLALFNYLNVLLGNLKPSSEIKVTLLREGIHNIIDISFLKDGMKNQIELIDKASLNTSAFENTSISTKGSDMNIQLYINTLE